MLAGLILLGAAGGAVWLQQTHKLQDLIEQPPTIAVQIPDEAVKPAETASETTPAASPSTTIAATTEPAPAAVAETGSNAGVGTPPAPATTETTASTETAPAPPAEATTAPAETTAASTEATTAPTETTTATAETTTTPAETMTAMVESGIATPPAPAETPVATSEPSTAETTATAPAASATSDTTTATPPPAPAEMPTASPATTEPAAPASAETTAAEATTAEATAPPPPTPVAESDAAAETAVPTAIVPLPRLKPPPPAAALPTLTASAESAASAAPAATTAAEATAPATASAGASLGSAATTSAVTAPAATEATQTASAAAPAASNAGAPPWKKNARAFPADDPRPRVSLVITGLGLTAAQTQAAIDQLPPEITLGFSPYSGELQNWIAKARAAGHEVLIELPMEPLNYPADDPGPQALLASLSPAENLKRLDWVLARSDQMVGLVANMGSKFQANARLIRPILTRIAEKGYLYVDNRSGPTSVVSEVAASVDLPWTYNIRFIDAEATRVSIDGRLQQLERTAREKGFALGLAQGYPVTIERVAAWTKSLEVKGLALAPASALAKTGAQ